MHMHIRTARMGKEREERRERRRIYFIYSKKI